MATVLKKFLLTTFFILGISTFWQSISITGLQDIWQNYCYTRPGSFNCNYGSSFWAYMFAGMTLLILGYWILVRWLNIGSLIRLILSSVVFAFLGYELFNYVFAHLDQYQSNQLISVLNWADYIVAGILASLILVVPVPANFKKTKSSKRSSK